MGIILRWDITNRCSLSCIHCYNRHVRKGVEDNDSIEYIEKIVHKLPQEHIQFIKLSGGEPFEYKNLDYLICQLEQKGIKVGITTNGLFSLNTRNANIIASSNLLFVTFSLDGHNVELARVFRQRLNFGRVIDNIGEIRKAKPDIGIAMLVIVNKNNYLFIQEILQYFVFDLGVDKVCLSDLDITNNLNVNKLKCSKDDLDIVLQGVDQFLSKNRVNSNVVELSFGCNLDMQPLLQAKQIQSEIRLDYRCRAGADSGYIDQYGNLFPCEAVIHLPDYQEYIDSMEYSLIEDDFWNIWMLPLFNRVYDYDHKFRFGNDPLLFRKQACANCIDRSERCGSCFFRNSEARP